MNETILFLLIFASYLVRSGSLTECPKLTCNDHGVCDERYR